MKKLLTLWMLTLLPFCLSAQNDAKAAEVLDQALTHLSGSSGIRADFQGTENGFLLLKGEKFYLNNGNIQSWYDGKTQWLYTTATEEVNMLEPTEEELQMSNPYMIIMGYNRNFTSQLMSSRGSHYIMRLNAKNTAAEISQVELTVDKLSYRIVKAIFMLSDGVKQEIKFSNYNINKKITDGEFVFDAKLVPAGTSVIDIR